MKLFNITYEKSAVDSEFVYDCTIKLYTNLIMKTLSHEIGNSVIDTDIYDFDTMTVDAQKTFTLVSVEDFENDAAITFISQSQEMQDFRVLN